MSDVVIVGGGAAGCVLAARLSENADRQVVLLEAGPDYPTPADLPADVADGWNVAQSHDWGYLSEPTGGDEPLALLRGRLMGGCSSLNATLALRGCARDYDAWADAGNVGWSFDDVLPAFCRAERDLDFGAEPWHGDAGPLPIRRYPDAELSDFSRRFLDAAAGEFGVVVDHNRPGDLGAGPAPVNTLDRLRMSTAVAYLPDARSRPNLRIRADAMADRIVVRAGRAEGVLLANGEVVEADAVVMAAGAYGSPAVLLRSGIGPPDELRDLGIDSLVPLPGVGRNLVDHPFASIDVALNLPLPDVPRLQTMVTWRSEHGPEPPAFDMQVLTSGPYGEPGEPPVGAVAFSVAKPVSRGRLRLRSPDPADSPRIDLAHLREPDDLIRMLEGDRVARRLARTAPLSDIVASVPDDPDDDVAEAALRARVGTYHHPVGTCAMGPDPDGGAVVDPAGAVHGVDGLRVADASIMPDIPAANTNLPTIMVAEHIAASFGGDG